MDVETIAKRLLALAERCEKVEGPDHGLDTDISVCLAGDPDKHDWRNHTWLAYSASLDAAMTLIPEGWRLANFGETVIEGNDPWNARVLEKRFDGRGGRAEGDAATPALALCAASLRARAALQENHDAS